MSEDPKMWWTRIGYLTAKTSFQTVPNSIKISTRNALNNAALVGVRVDYSVRGVRLGSVVSGPLGMAVITTRYVTDCCIN